MTDVKLSLRGLRGESFADVGRRLGTIGGIAIAPTLTDQQIMDLLINAAEADADRAETALGEIEDIVLNSADAASVVGKLNKVETLAALADQNTGVSWAWVAEVDAIYEWDAASILDADGWGVIAPTVGSGRWVLYSNDITVQPDSVGGTDAARLLGAGTACRIVHLAEGAAYELSETVDLSALSLRVIYMNGATISAASGFTDLHLLQISGDTHLIGPGTFDGTNVPGPSALNATITGATKANPCVITATAHGFKNLEYITISGVGGMTELNSTGFLVKNVTANTFELSQPLADVTIDSSAYGTYTSGGTASRPLAYNAGGYAGVGVFVAGSGDNGLIQDVVFQNFQSGAVKNDNRIERNRWRIIRCGAVNCQIDAVAQSNPVFSIENSNYGLMEDCYIDGYNWKGFYFSNGIFNKIVRCHSDGGNVGHASHYLTGGSDNTLESCTHTGVGFGFKMSNTTRPVIRNFIAKNCQSGGMVQGSPDFLVTGMRVEEPAVAALFISGESPAVLGGTVRDFWAERATAGTTSNHTGIDIAAASGGIIDGLTIDGYHIVNMFYGFRFASTGFQQSNVNIRNGEMTGIVQYGILGYCGSGQWSNNRIVMDGTGSPTVGIYLSRDGATTTGIMEISKNEISGCPGDNIQIGEGTRLAHDQILVKDNRVKGGAKFLDYQGNANVADVVNLLVVTGNSGTGLTTNGCTLTFNGTTATVLHQEHNAFVNASFVDIGDTYATTTNLRVKGVIPFIFTWDPGSLADGAGETKDDITAVGAVLSVSSISITPPYDLQGITATAYVKSNGVVGVRLQNETGGTIDLASGSWKGRVYNP